MRTHQRHHLFIIHRIWTTIVRSRSHILNQISQPAAPTSTTCPHITNLPPPLKPRRTPRQTDTGIEHPLADAQIPIDPARHIFILGDGTLFETGAVARPEDGFVSLTEDMHIVERNAMPFTAIVWGSLTSSQCFVSCRQGWWRL